MRDQAYVNALIRTVDVHDSVAEAMLVRDGRIVVTGTRDEVLARATPTSEIVDAGGKTIVPGFIDPHNHLSHTMLEAVSVDCSIETRGSIDGVLDALSRAAAAALPGQWIRGYGFTPWALPDEREPSLGELDEAVARNPFFLQDVSCHRGWANSEALREVGIDEFSPQPWGGVVVEDHAGRPTGALLEAAMNPFQTLSWREVVQRNPEETLALLNEKMRSLASLGVTGLCDAAVTPDVAELYARADRAGSLLFTVQQLHTADDFFARQDPKRPDFVKRIHDRESEHLRGGTMKVFADPGFPDGPRITCAHGGHDVHRGSSWYSAAELREIVSAADRLDIRTAVHAMGNWAVGAVLDAYETVRMESPRSSGLMRIEHAFVSDPQGQGPRMADLGVDLVTMPGLLYDTGPAFDRGWRGDLKNELTVIPVKTLLDAGVRVSFASDEPTGPFSPAELIWNAVTRASRSGEPIDPHEAVSASEALRCSTINAAHAANRGGEEGSLEAGKRANFAILDRDIVTCPPHEIREMRVLRTVINGRTVSEDGQGLE